MKIRNIILYILSAILFLGYLLIFFRGIDTSRATDAYNLFYVTRESKHYFTQGYLNDKYCTDILFEYKEDGNYINQSKKGWGDPEENGTWIIGNEASAYIVVNDTSKDYLFTVYSRKDNGYDNELYVNGDFAGKLVFDGTPAEAFSETERLLKWGLDLPPAVRIRNALRAEGLAIPDHILELEELADWLAAAGEEDAN